MYTSSTRMTGLASGTDTDTYVKQLMFAASTKYYNQQRKLQKLQWKQTAYRDTAKKINTFQGKWLDLTSSTSLRLNKTFTAKFKSSVTGSTGETASGVKVTNINGNGSHDIKVINSAKSAQMTSSSVVSGSIDPNSGESNFNFTYKGDTKAVTLSSQLLKGTVDADGKEASLSGDQILTEIQKSIESQIGNNNVKVNVTNDNGKYNVSISSSDGTAGRSMALASATTTESKTNVYSVKYDGVTTKFEAELNSEGNPTGSIYFNNKKYSGNTITDSLNEALKDKYGFTKNYGETTSTQAVTVESYDSASGEFALNAAADITYNIVTTENPLKGEVSKENDEYTIKYTDRTSSDEGQYSFSLTKNEKTNDDDPDTYTLKINGVVQSFADENETTTELTKEQAEKVLNDNLNSEFGTVKSHSVETDSETGRETVKDTDDDISAAVVAKIGDDGSVSIGFTPENVHDGDKNLDHEIANEMTTLTRNVTSSNFEVTKSDSKAKATDSITSLVGDIKGTSTVTINDKQIVIDADTTISDFVSRVNESGAGVKMSYSAVSGSFTIATTETGEDQEINLGTDDTSKAVFAALGFTQSTAKGSNALVEVDGVMTESATNKLEFEEFTADITNAKVGEEYNVTSSRDVDGIYSMISDFVKDYNELISGVRSTYTEQRAEGTKGYYEPLTDQEKKEMDEKDIEKWETEAKKGILYNDSILKGFNSAMRTTIYSQTTTNKYGNSSGIYNYGITTSSDMSKAGELTIDESKLKAALEDDPEAVIDVIKKVAESMNSVVKDYTGSNGKLAMRAGIEGTSTAYNNSLYSEIKSLKDKMSTELERLKTKEQNYYTMFAKMEETVSKNNTNLDALYSM